MNMERDLVAEFLVARGWHRQASGRLGDKWAHGDRLTVVPHAVQYEGPTWNNLVLMLSRAVGEPTADVVWHFERASREREIVRNVGRVELDAHLTNRASRHEHETAAYGFGRFVMNTADAVKEIVKSERGVKRQARDLQVVGGPGEGSVQVLFREPDRSDPDALFPEPPETSEGQALVQLGAVFRAAQGAIQEPEGDVLRSHLEPLHAGARLGVARLAETLVDGGWNLTGVLRRGGEQSEVGLTVDAAGVLGATARAALERYDTTITSGVLDGWVWSASELSMVSDEFGSIRVAVPLTLQRRVAELNAERDTRVLARLNRYSQVASGTGDKFSTTYSLQAIGPAGAEMLPSD